MLRKDIRIGATYAVKVSGRVVCVKVTCDLGDDVKQAWDFYNRHNYRKYHRGWEGINLKSGRRVHLRSAAKCRREILPPDPIELDNLQQEMDAVTM